jgi:D-arabinose 1-dehydrogenase-like Zn-dependent alcohol dehydrogenase
VDARILAAVMPAPRESVEIREFPRPDLPPQGALLRTARAEVCGTDVHLWHGRLAGVPYPIIPGHVSAGTLEAVRGPLEGIDRSTLREGDRAVFFDVHRTCGRCRACTVHRTPTRCSSRRVYGITDPASEGLINRKHLETRGCWGSEPGHFLRALTILERHAGHVPWREIGERVYPLTGLNDALGDADSMRITKAIVDPWRAA